MNVALAQSIRRTRLPLHRHGSPASVIDATVMDAASLASLALLVLVATLSCTMAYVVCARVRVRDASCCHAAAAFLTCSCYNVRAIPIAITDTLV